jgi:Ca2+-binding RTX toxin-like protein
MRLLKRLALPATLALVMVAYPASYASAGPLPTCFGRTATIVGTPNDDENVEGTEENDVIVTMGGDDIVHAHAGNDTICLGSGADQAFGGRGNEQVRAGAGNDLVKDIRPQFNEVFMEEGNDRSVGPFFAHGGPGDDRLGPSRRAPVSVELDGGGGDDILIGTDEVTFAEGDILQGGRGNDVIKGKSAYNVLVPGPGRDDVRMGRDRRTWAGVLSYVGATGDLQIDLKKGIARGQGRDTISGRTTQVVGSDGDDEIFGKRLGQWLLGRDGKDLLRGRGGSDVLYGEDGRDRADGGPAEDSCRAEVERRCETNV